MSGPGQGLVLLAPALARLLRVCRLPDARRRLAELHEMERPDARPSSSSASTTMSRFSPRIRCSGTAVRNTVLWTVMSVVFPPAIGFALALALNQNIPGRTSAARAVLHAGHHRADRRRDDVAMDVRSVLRSVQRRADGARAAGPHSGLARRSQRRALFDVRRLRLADGRLFAGSVPRRTAGRLARR